MNKIIEQPQENPKITIDLNDWWEQIQKEDVEKIINKKRKWKYFLVDNEWVTTIVNRDIKNYKADEVDIINNETAEIPEAVTQAVTQATTPELLKNLVLDPTCEVKDTLDAEEKARYSDKKKFRFKKGNMVTIIDLSNPKKPKIEKYQLDKYNLKQKTVKI